MEKITSFSDLKKIKAQAQKDMLYRERSNNPETHVEIKVFMDTRGIQSGSKEIMDYLIEISAEEGVETLIYQTSGEREPGNDPCLEVRKPGQAAVQFSQVDKKKAHAIIEQYIKQNKSADEIKF